MRCATSRIADIQARAGKASDVMGWSVMKFLAIVCFAVVGSTLVVGAAQSADAKAALSPAAVDRASLSPAAAPESLSSSML